MKRCTWAGNDLNIPYHDTEWGVPVHDDRALFEFLVLEGAQAGLSWDTILRKRDNYRAAFDNFDPAKVAAYGDKKVAELLDNEGIIRNRLKIASAIGNAKAFLKVQEEFGSFDKYIWGFVGGKPVRNKFKGFGDVPAKTEMSDAISKDLKKRGFNFVGSTIMYAFMQATGMVNDHLTSCFRYKEVILKGKVFEKRVNSVLLQLKSSFPDRVEIIPQPKIHLYNKQAVIPDFDLRIDLFFEKAGYIIECQHRKRSNPSILQKIKYIKGLSERNKFIFVYAENVPRVTIRALRSDGILCMSFKQFVIFIGKISLVLKRVSELYGELEYEELLKTLVWYYLDEIPEDEDIKMQYTSFCMP